MRFAPLLWLPLMAACVETGGQAGGPVAVATDRARIAGVSIRPSRLTVEMSDGTTCVADRPEGVAGGWSGVTGGCGHALPFTVTFARGGEAARFAIERGFGTVTAAGVPGPRAEAFVTDVDGVRRLFVGPLPERVFVDA